MIETGKEITAHTEQETMALAARLAQAWLQRESGQHEQQCAFVVTLHGDLGAGKTTFTRGFMRACGFDGVVKSPTYTLVEPYAIDGTTIYHFDLYRLADPEELEFIGVRDCFAEQALCLIEWPEKAESALPAADIECHIVCRDTARLIKLRPNSDAGKLLMLQAFSYQSL